MVAQFPSFIDHYSIDDLKNGLPIRSHNLNTTSPLFRSYCIGKYKLMLPITGIVKVWLLDVSGNQVSSIQIILHLSLSCRSCSTDAFHYWISTILIIGCTVFRSPLFCYRFPRAQLPLPKQPNAVCLWPSAPRPTRAQLWRT